MMKIRYIFSIMLASLSVVYSAISAEAEAFQEVESNTSFETLVAKSSSVEITWTDAVLDGGSIMLGLRIDHRYDASIMLANKMRTHSSNQIIYYIEDIKGGGKEKLIELAPLTEQKIALNIGKCMMESPENKSSVPQLADGMAGSLDSKAVLLTRQKLQKLIVPNLQVRQTNIVDVLEYLSRAIADADIKDKSGVKIVLGAGAEAAASHLKQINMVFSRVSALHALKVITGMYKLTYSIDGNIVTVLPRDVTNNRHNAVLFLSILKDKTIQAGTLDWWLDTDRPLSKREQIMLDRLSRTAE